MIPEHVILLDPQGNPCGIQDKATVHHQDTPLHLAFSCWIFNPEGELLITRRARSKRAWPGVWTNSVCGHPQQGETFEQAIVRRCHYETGLTVEEIAPVYPAFRYRARDTGQIVENEICPVYAALSQMPVQPRADEVMDWRWISLEEALREIDGNPDYFSPWMVSQASHPPARQQLLQYAQALKSNRPAWSRQTGA
ncbi:isopentenyl-diphosphate delta-isomerase [Shimwellia blattae DSM 4481 = NBRC 105725]|uniref:Isopentenyl-diphosphate Delta-isomerase n=1 Tax=Shimwellia blattae (strain ATCC 29907 / DSM 4481 / JCM 1650 / NBRC 105725 / CDC 9005-74) TaxID=630626 RepID=I2B4Z6_SHIBC|nr:isopentenyl-diphosphate Delta-isomerase [Shimwellia blattae]AFJ45600.1 isopentenyl-diphosphate delta-isomerase [Shimwellia blattae DSM 4481 = NBRC 105725]GAB81461.1 isopentenyl-diphosphate Delta-isomerase [Shimwellia blattae DSM 4481 = NBRC 105725]VEC20266.1 Isopentenyl-diphosphate Delta-isomerase [Shimwellia blattae]